MKYAILIVVLLAVSGCVSQTARNDGLAVSMSPDPPQIFQQQSTTLFVDIDNTDTKTLYNVVFDLFDTGIMKISGGTPIQNAIQQPSSCTSGDFTYTVSSGEVLWNIVKNYYGITDNVQIANKVNEIVDYNLARGGPSNLNIDDRSYTSSGVSNVPDGIRGDVISPGDKILFPSTCLQQPQPTQSIIVGCRKSFSKLDPKEFQTFSCELQPGEVLNSVITVLSAKTTFSAEFDAVQLIQMISQQEYERKKAAGTFATLPTKYAYSDRNIELDIEFSQDLPVIESSGKSYYIYLTLKNIGNGFIGDINPDDFIITQGSVEKSQIQPGPGGVASNTVKADNLVKCDHLDELRKTRGKLSPIGKIFPKITCQLTPPDNIDVIGNYPMNIKINYDYEVRQSADVRIVK